MRTLGKIAATLGVISVIAASSTVPAAAWYCYRHHYYHHGYYHHPYYHHHGYQPLLKENFEAASTRGLPLMAAQ